MILLKIFNMYKKLWLIFFAATLFQGCSDKFVSVISTGSPEILTEKKEVVDVEGYILENQEKFDFLIEKNELVQYQTRIPEKQKWKRRNSEWLTVSGIFGFFSLFSIDGVKNGFEGENGETEYLDKGTPFVIGAIALVCLIPYFGKAYEKTIYNQGEPIKRNEWTVASNERFAVSYMDQQTNYSTDVSGKLSINPYEYKFPVLTDHQNFKLSFSKDEFLNFNTATINSSWWMKEYGIINNDPVHFLGKLNSYPSELPKMMGFGSTIFDKQQGYSQLKIKNNEAWIKPQFLNIFIYSSPKELGNIPALKLLDYNNSKDEIIEEQKQTIENFLNN